MNHRALISFVTSLTLRARLSAGENGSGNKSSSQPRSPPLHSNLSNYRFCAIFLNISPPIFLALPQNTSIQKQHCTSKSPDPPLQETPRITKQASSNSSSSCLCFFFVWLLEWIQQSPSRSKQPEVKLLSVVCPYPGHGLSCMGTGSTGSRTLNRITSLIFGLLIPGSSFSLQGRPSSNQSCFPWQCIGCDADEEGE